MKRSDTEEWLTHLGLEEMPAEPTKPFLVEQASKLLRDEAITTPNTMCYFLGLGTGQSVLDRAAINDFEITEVGRYTEWRKRRWNWDWQMRHNPSEPFLTREDLPAADLDYIHQISREDQTLYDAIMKALDAAGTDCVRGADLG